MNAPDNNTSVKAAEYVAIVKDLWPLAMVSGVASLIGGVRGIKRGYLQRTPLQVVGNVLFSSLVASMLAMCCVLLAPLVIGDINPAVELGIAVFIGVGGMKGFDALLRWKSGLRVVDMFDPEDMRDLRGRMHPDDRKRHADFCPFRDDMTPDVPDRRGGDLS